MSNGSLENWLLKEDCHLNFLQRVAIMLDVVVAVEYLHHSHHTYIVHCDLNLANVLLDEEMVAHVAVFGISKVLVVSKSITHTVTLGSLGYIALDEIMSISCNVYSYGIMLREVLATKRPMDEEIFNKNLGLAWISEFCIASMIELSLDCTEDTPESRITMKDVVKRLNKTKNVFLET
ncbi:hypothetical protein CQW23_12207 [Capsicum baccatum]|uniref:Protein kinase domain-containing protein n=1 Tax=Capsicum baccatum TaxID=33114 RepID=A0A2G2WS38_CAPBA|nr:hypothetical protein CQW23_12207 [Capsicum baccatum]